MNKMILKIVEQEYHLTFGFVKDKVGEPGTEPYLMEAKVAVSLVQTEGVTAERLLEKVHKTIAKYNGASFLAESGPLNLEAVRMYFPNVHKFEHQINEEGVLEFLFLKLVRMPGFLGITLETTDKPGRKLKWTQ